MDDKEADDAKSESTTSKTLTATLSTSTATTGTVDSERRAPLKVTLSQSINDQTTFSTESLRVLEEIKRRREADRLRKKNQLSNQHSRSIELKASTIRQHYYPEGGYGWIVLCASCIVHALTNGLQLSFGVLSIELRQKFLKDVEPQSSLMQSVWLGSLSYAVSLFAAPVVVGFCRHKSARLTGIFGGLIAALGLLFSSFATQYHQVFVSYGIILSLGAAGTREVANHMVGQYFKRRREMVEIALEMGTGLGISLMAPFIHYGIRTFGWRRGIQILALTLFSQFILGTLYRSASLYHPQRRAILHLKTQRRKIREKNPVQEKSPFFDFTSLQMKSQRALIVSLALAGFAFPAPYFYLGEHCFLAAKVNQEQRLVMVLDSGFNQTVLDNVITAKKPRLSSITLESWPEHVVMLHVYVGLSLATGALVAGLLLARPSAECRISRKYFCQTVLLGMSVSLATIVSLDEIACGGTQSALLLIYSAFLGAIIYASKMLCFERVRARFSSRAWSLCTWSQSIPILLGVPAVGYLNANFDLNGKAGLTFASATFTVSSIALCFAPLTEPKPKAMSSIRSHPVCSPQGSGPSKDTIDRVRPLASNTSDGLPRLESMGSSGGNGQVPPCACVQCGHQKFLIGTDVPVTVPDAICTNEQPPAKKPKQESDTACMQEKLRRISSHEEDDEDDLDDDLVALSKGLSPAYELGTFFSDDLPLNASMNIGEQSQMYGKEEDDCDNAIGIGRRLRGGRLKTQFETVDEEAALNAA